MSGPEGRGPEDLNPLQRERDALADADAHGAERAPAAGGLELIERGDHQPAARSAQRMTERDRAAIGVHLFRVVGQTELAQHCERLGSESFVELDGVKVLYRHTELG